MHKAIATLGVWAAVGVVGCFDPLAAIGVSIGAVVVTAIIWES